jgi:predicted DNA-binding protein YlxM (UPF0122 family)
MKSTIDWGYTIFIIVVLSFPVIAYIIKTTAQREIRSDADIEIEALVDLIDKKDKQLGELTQLLKCAQPYVLSERSDLFEQIDDKIKEIRDDN